MEQTMPANFSPEGKGRRFPLHVHITTLFSALILAAGVAIGWLGYAQSRDIALHAADESFQRIGVSVSERLRGVFSPVREFTQVLAAQPLVQASLLEERLGALAVMAVMLHQNPAVAEAFAGYPDGGSFIVRPLPDQAAKAFFQAPASAAFLVQSVDFPSSGRREYFLFFDRNLREIERRTPATYDFDPRTRPWYALAERAGELVLTDPYVFFSTKAPGVTFAMRTDAGSVVGVDVTLQQASEILAGVRISPDMQIVLFDQERRVLACSDVSQSIVVPRQDGLVLATLPELGPSALRWLLPARPGADPTKGFITASDGRKWMTAVFPAQSLRGPLSLGIALPMDELLAGARQIRNRGLFATLAVLLLALPLTWWTSRRISNALGDITRRAREIQRFNFSGGSAANSAVLEVDQLAGAMNLMQDTIQRFLDIAVALVAEKKFDSLLERLVRETVTATGAWGGAVFLVDDEGATLVPASAISAGGGEVGLLPMETSADSPVALAFRSRETVSVTGEPDAVAAAALAGLFPGGMRPYTAIPLCDREGEATGVLVLPGDVDAGLSSERIAFAEALSGTAAIAIENQRLLDARKALLEALIRLIAGAIDAKSPYTGGHCARVPELTLILAQAACDASDGPLRDFALTDEEWEAVQIASWLHDCGKLTTPEYVVDKATKLETLYDRIHEIRMRFEVLKRDAEIDCWKGIAAGGDRNLLQTGLQARQRDLDDEFAFIARCNEGGEAMAPGDVARLREVASRSWCRTLDDRIGISQEEKIRKSKTPVPLLPVMEPLLADRPDHVIARTGANLLSPDNPWGFKMEIPEFQYNRGEIYNLSVGRGTLTEEDRYVINHHIVQTILMLSELPFPRHLKQIPEIAGGHHEKMNGTGYPKGLCREEMSPVARMMAVADIFEALTAADRPYKKPKSLSESIRIMHALAQEGHIDPDLFDLFLTSGVYLRYAERFLKPGCGPSPGAPAGRSSSSASGSAPRASRSGSASTWRRGCGSRSPPPCRSRRRRSRSRRRSGTATGSGPSCIAAPP